MTVPDLESNQAGRFRATVVRLVVLIIILILVGLSIHRNISNHGSVWKSSPYGEPRDTASVRAGR
jgi:hypothetical protein